jgi:hypothetical protein
VDITDTTEVITALMDPMAMSTATMDPVSTTTLNTVNLDSEVIEAMTAMIVMVVGVAVKAEEKVVEGLGITVRGPTLE